MERLFDAPDEPPEDARVAPPPAGGPLAARMRPRSLADYVGQEHLLGEGSALRTTLESGDPHSMVLFGPPGTGKTTLARLAAEHADAEDAMQRKAVLYDKGGDQHYDYISAWIKSTRGSDPDASLYYLAAMLEGGEDPRFIVRRMVVLASEDVGNADPQALRVATATAAAVEHVGLPDCTYALAQCAIYLSLAPKSNAAGRALGAARAHIRDHGAQLPPAPLRSAAYPAAAKLGRGLGYDYPHDHPGQINDQEHLPEGLEDVRFYDPRDMEPALRERLEQVRRARGL
jgi:putative ATPase